MSSAEIITLARRIARELRDGFVRAARYLRGLGWTCEMACAALLSAA